jgi:hypothetical protein
MLRDLSQPHGPSTFDQHSEQATAMGQVPDRLRDPFVDAGVDEPKQEPVITNHADRCVLCSYQLAREIRYALKQSIQV